MPSAQQAPQKKASTAEERLIAGDTQDVPKRAKIVGPPLPNIPTELQAGAAKAADVMKQLIPWVLVSVVVGI